MIAVASSCLHLNHHDLFQVIEHSLLLHRWRMLFGYSLSLDGKLVTLLDIFFDLCLNIFLVAARVQEALATALDVVCLLIQALHFQFNQLILQLVKLDLRVHCVDLISQFGYNSLYLLDIILNFGSNAQKRLFFGFVLVFDCLKLLENLLLFLKFRSQGTLLLSDLIQEFLNLLINFLNWGILNTLIGNESLTFYQSEWFFKPRLLIFQKLFGSLQVTSLPLDFFDFLFAFSIFGFLLLQFTKIIFEFVLFEANTFDFVDLLLFFTDFSLKSWGFLFLNFKFVLGLLFLFCHKCGLAFVNGKFIILCSLLWELFLHLTDCSS